MNSESATFFRPVHWPGIELMRAKWLKHSFPKHAHDCYTIGINSQGRGRYDCNGETHEAEPGRLNLIAPGEIHTGQPLDNRGWAYFGFYIEPATINSILLSAGVNKFLHFCSASVVDHALNDRLRRVFISLTAPAPDRFQQQEQILVSFRQLATRHSEARSTTQYRARTAVTEINRVREYLMANYALDDTVSDLAALVGWNSYHLIREFHRTVGLPPHAFRNTVRVNAARKLLSKGMPIADAALACGFYDQSHLYRTFRGIVGATPGRYSEACAISSKT